jgi:hypothetical protein
MAAPSRPLVAALTRELAKFPQIDARAALAIAAHEGLSGGIGDNGTSFGPFQLHRGGALPSGIGGNAQQWAWSPAGIDYALSRIASVAGGLKGLSAISAISRRFERPADPASEIADAARHYGLAPMGGSSIQSGGGAAAAVPSLPMAAAAPDTHAFAQNLLGAISPTGQLDNPALLLRALQARRAQMGQP